MRTRPDPPPPLPEALARRLLGAAASVWDLKPWTYMSDLHLVGTRDEENGELRVASILGARREVFGLVLHRGSAGLGWLHTVATSGSAPEADETIEAMDCLKVEWTVKRELEPWDLELLRSCRAEPKGRGPIWLRFQTHTPGWYPWFPSELEARQIVDDLGKVARFAALFATHPDIYAERPPGDIALVRLGDGPLGPEDIDWMPFVPLPRSSPEPFVLDEDEEQQLLALPRREDAIFEIAAPLVPEIRLLDDASGRPYIARFCLVSDQRSYYVLACEFGHGGRGLTELVGKVFVSALRAAKARPRKIQVENERLLAVLRPACARLDIAGEVNPRLLAARDAFGAVRERFLRKR